MTPFEPWLRQLAATGQRVPDALCPQIDRGLQCLYRFTLEGNWASATVHSSLRLDPDASGATIVDFTCVNEGYDAAAGMTTFLLFLSSAETTALPPDSDGDALVQLAWDVLFQPSGGANARLFGGVATVRGKVTNG